MSIISILRNPNHMYTGTVILPLCMHDRYQYFTSYSC